jgi:hypothetical protein
MKTTKLYIHVIFFVLAMGLILFSHCKIDNLSTDKIDNLSTDQISQLIWETNGGGDIKFTVCKNNNTFTIHLERYAFKANTARGIIEENNSAYHFLTQIFSGEINMKDYTFTPQGCTGSWTQVTVFYADNSSETIKNILLHDQLRVLYQLAENLAKQN